LEDVSNKFLTDILVEFRDPDYCLRVTFDVSQVTFGEAPLLEERAKAVMSANGIPSRQQIVAFDAARF